MRKHSYIGDIQREERRERILIAVISTLVLAMLIGAYMALNTDEMRDARCARYDLTRTFDDCAKSKSCAIQSGRHAEWYEWTNYRSATYDCHN